VRHGQHYDRPEQFWGQPTRKPAARCGHGDVPGQENESETYHLAAGGVDIQALERLELETDLWRTIQQ
jgi:hypothetical protein